MRSFTFSTKHNFPNLSIFLCIVIHTLYSYIHTMYNIYNTNIEKYLYEGEITFHFKEIYFSSQINGQ